MSTCNHNPEINPDGTIICKLCGNVLPYMEETVARVQSERQARRILDEIATSGNFVATHVLNGLPVFRHGYTELTIKPIGLKKFLVVKKYIGGEQYIQYVNDID